MTFVVDHGGVLPREPYVIKRSPDEHIGVVPHEFGMGYPISRNSWIGVPHLTKFVNWGTPSHETRELGFSRFYEIRGLGYPIWEFARYPC